MTGIARKTNTGDKHLTQPLFIKTHRYQCVEAIPVTEIPSVILFLLRVAKHNHLACVNGKVPLKLTLKDQGSVVLAEFETVKIQDITFSHSTDRKLILTAIRHGGQELPADGLFLLTGQWLLNTVVENPPRVAPWVDDRLIKPFIPGSLEVVQAARLKERHVINP